MEDAPDPDVLPDPDADFSGADDRGDVVAGDGEDDHINDELGDDEPGEEEVLRGRTQTQGPPTHKEPQGSTISGAQSETIAILDWAYAYTCTEGAWIL